MEKKLHSKQLSSYYEAKTDTVSVNVTTFSHDWSKGEKLPENTIVAQQGFTLTKKEAKELIQRIEKALKEADDIAARMRG
jgi:hypothetical protein